MQTVSLIVLMIIGVIGVVYYSNMRAQPAQQTPQTTMKTTENPVNQTVYKITVGSAVRYSTSYYLPITVGEDRGIWKRNGLEVTWQPFTGGPQLNTAFASGAIDLGLHSVQGAYSGIARGVPMKIVAVYRTMTTLAVLVDPNGPIHSVADLNGKSVAVASVGGLQQAYMQATAKRNNLNVTYVAGGDTPQLLALLKTGKVQAVILESGGVASSIVSKEVVILHRISDDLPQPWGEIVAVASPSMIASHPDLVKRFLKALREIITYIVQNPESSIQSIINVQQFSPDAAKTAYDDIKPTWAPELTIRPVALQNVIDVLVAGGVEKPMTSPISTLYDDSRLP